MRSLCSIIALVGVLIAPRPAPAQTHYKVIVNANNPAAILMASELSRIFLGTANVWPDRTTMVLAIDQKSGSVRDTFLHEIIGKDSTQLSRYWEQAIFSGKAVPPRTLASDSEIVEFVRSNPGAIAYVDASTALGSDVKVLRIVR